MPVVRAQQQVYDLVRPDEPIVYFGAGSRCRRDGNLGTERVRAIATRRFDPKHQCLVRHLGSHRRPSIAPKEVGDAAERDVSDLFAPRQRILRQREGVEELARVFCFDCEVGRQRVDDIGSASL
jgi:hypothetical protein